MYQISYIWHWLTYGNNATAVAATGASMAALFAFLAYLASNRQLKLAQSGDQRDFARYQDESRPHLSIQIDDVLESDPNWKWVIIRNIGKGTATDIRRNKALLTICNSLPAGGTFRTQVQVNGPDFESPGSQTILLFYASTDGRLFRTQTKIVGIICILWEGVQQIDEDGNPPPIEVGARGPDQSYIE